MAKLETPNSLNTDEQLIFLEIATYNDHLTQSDITELEKLCRLTVLQNKLFKTINEFQKELENLDIASRKELVLQIKYFTTLVKDLSKQSLESSRSLGIVVATRPEQEKVEANPYDEYIAE